MPSQQGTSFHFFASITACFLARRSATEAQIAYANAHARFFSNTADVEANRECEAVRKRLFDLFTDGCEDEKWILKAWNHYRRRLTHHHRADS